MVCLLCGSRDCHLRCILSIMRESAGVEPGPGRVAEPPFFDPCLLPWDLLAGTGLLERCFVVGVLERCSIRMLSDPRFPAALLTREVLPASTPGPTRACCFCSFLLIMCCHVRLLLLAVQEPRRHLYHSAYVPEKQV